MDKAKIDLIKKKTLEVVKSIFPNQKLMVTVGVKNGRFEYMWIIRDQVLQDSLSQKDKKSRFFGRDWFDYE